jgi:hypothetical protein
LHPKSLAVTPYATTRLNDFSSTDSRQSFLDSLHIRINKTGRVYLQRYDDEKQKWETAASAAVALPGALDTGGTVAASNSFDERRLRDFHSRWSAPRHSRTPPTTTASDSASTSNLASKFASTSASARIRARASNPTSVLAFTSTSTFASDSASAFASDSASAMALQTLKLLSLPI